MELDHPEAHTELEAIPAAAGEVPSVFILQFAVPE
jgi:hypothetical protein